MNLSKNKFYFRVTPIPIYEKMNMINSTIKSVQKQTWHLHIINTRTAKHFDGQFSNIIHILISHNLMINFTFIKY